MTAICNAESQYLSHVSYCDCMSPDCNFYMYMTTFTYYFLLLRLEVTLLELSLEL